MKKVHLCCGDVYLKDYENCDIDGYIISKLKDIAVRTMPTILNPEDLSYQQDMDIIELDGVNPNETTLDKYFKFPFESDATRRVRREFILDTKMNILDKWPWKTNSVDEIVMVNALEHFEHIGEVEHIIAEVKRVLKKGGIFKFDFPDIKAIVEQFHDSDPVYCINLLYCNHKNKYSIHQWGYTAETISSYFGKDFKLEFKDVVKHDYPSQGVHATRIK